jgi:vacuolar-type H+-ATPase subunit I/STV1
MMTPRKQKKFNKTMIEQRNEARAAMAALEGTVLRLSGNIDELVADRLKEIEARAQADVQKFLLRTQSAEDQLKYLKADLKAAAQTVTMELKAELALTKAELVQAVDLRDRFSQEIESLGMVLFEKNQTIENLRELSDGYAAELSTLKAEDNKSLRKRLETKSKIIESQQTEMLGLIRDNKALEAKLSEFILQVAQMMPKEEPAAPAVTMADL